ncbi:MAG: hypothetical protein Q9160_002909 [Pyrenula sp. 1 TL-2023]
MAGTQPVAVYALKVPPGDFLVPAVPDFAAMFRVSMAAIDPTEELDEEDKKENKPLRATLKLIRPASDNILEDSDDDDDDEDDDDESSEDEEVNGGPSDPSKSSKKKNKKLLNGTADESSEDEDDEDEESLGKAALSKLLKGKAPAIDDEEDDDEDDMDIDEAELEETVVCTLDPAQHYQQPLDLVVGEDEKIFFKVSGTHTIHLTGNYVIPADDGRASMYDEDEYDLSPDEDEVDELDELEEDEEEDELDDMEDPRVMELDTDEEEAPKLIKAELKQEIKGNKKRSAPDSSDAEEPASLDDIMAKSLKPADPAAIDESKLSKSQLKKLRKKQKKNDGEAAAVVTTTTVETPASSIKSDTGKKEPATNGEKKVQFAEKLEQGPTPSPSAKSSDNSQSTTTGQLGVKNVQGVTIDDRKLGKGPAAKKGDRVGVRYIGKVADSGKVFDANKKGKPFSFKVGSGEVIKGWDIGIIGMSVGCERRITVPASLAYGSKGAPPDIPPNAKLQFDLKMLELK